MNNEDGSILKKIHVNQHSIRSNLKTGERKPVVTVKTYKKYKDSKRQGYKKTDDKNFYGHEISILGKDGKEVARVVYRPDDPLNCGARLWVETENQINVIDTYNGDKDIFIQ